MFNSSVTHQNKCNPPSTVHILFVYVCLWYVYVIFAAINIKCQRSRASAPLHPCSHAQGLNFKLLPQTGLVLLAQATEQQILYPFNSRISSWGFVVVLWPPGASLILQLQPQLVDSFGWVHLFPPQNSFCLYWMVLHVLQMRRFTTQPAGSDTLEL